MHLQNSATSYLEMAGRRMKQAKILDWITLASNKMDWITLATNKNNVPLILLYSLLFGAIRALVSKYHTLKLKNAY